MTIKLKTTVLRITYPFLALALALALLNGADSLLAALFSLFVHELGHAAAAAAFGERIEEFALTPVGASIKLAEGFRTPFAEGFIALSGPLASFAFAAALTGAALFLPFSPPLESLITSSYMIALVNLIPAFPLDGGRVLGAVLRRFFSRGSARAVCATLGLLWAAGFVALSALALVEGAVNPIPAALGVVIALGVFREIRSEKYERALSAMRRADTLRRGGALGIRVVAMNRKAPIKAALRREGSPLIAVMDDSMNHLGLLGEGDLLRGLATMDENAPIGRLLPIGDTPGELRKTDLK